MSVRSTGAAIGGGGGGGVTNNFTATRAPLPTDDFSAGYASGSVWLWPDTGVIWRCRSAALNAGVWLQMDSADFFGYVVNEWCIPYGVTGYVNGSAGVAGRSGWLPWVNKQRCTISALGLRIITAAAGGNAQVALYAADPATHRPTGLPLATTVSMSTAAATNVNAAVSVQIESGLFWFATCLDNATATVVSALASGAPTTGQLIGSATENNTLGASSASLQFLLTGTFGTWPDMTSVSLSETVGGGAYTPLPRFKIGSIP